MGDFKLQYIEGLKAKGVDFEAVYGNTGTDIKVYNRAGIPKVLKKSLDLTQKGENFHFEPDWIS